MIQKKPVVAKNSIDNNTGAALYICSQRTQRLTLGKVVETEVEAGILIASQPEALFPAWSANP